MPSSVLVFLQFFLLLVMFAPLWLIPTEYGWIGAFIALSAALKLLLWTSLHNRVGNFNIVPEIKEGSRLIISGPYQWIRHPMYTAVLLVALAAFSYGFAWFKVVVFISLLGVMILKAKREEKYWEEASSEYKRYKDETKMFIPYLI